MAALVEEIDPSERTVALEVHQLAVKARNAIAHGAITTFDSYTADGVGHLIVKSTQGLVAVGLHSMTRVAAYYRSLRPGRDDWKYELQNWVEGEEEVLDLVRRSAAS
jgi:hypothetical protein